MTTKTTPETTTTTQTHPAKRAYHACRCGTVDTGPAEDIVNNSTGETVALAFRHYGECTAQTRRTFAPGHDARLKGVLIRLARAGHPYRVGGIESDPIAYAEQFGFAEQVQAGAARVVVKRPRAERANRVRTPKAVKIGRWTYPVVGFDPETHTVTYRNKRDEEVSTQTYAPLYD